jgi:hypothetical protein
MSVNYDNENFFFFLIVLKEFLGDFIIKDCIVHFVLCDVNNPAILSIEDMRLEDDFAVMKWDHDKISLEELLKIFRSKAKQQKIPLPPPRYEKKLFSRNISYLMVYYYSIKFTFKINL